MNFSCFLFRCKLIALGNGTACRETEKWISELIAAGILNSNVRYSIVTEQGASIYSCGEIAKKEFPDMDVNLISAGKQHSICELLETHACKLNPFQNLTDGAVEYRSEVLIILKLALMT